MAVHHPTETDEQGERPGEPRRVENSAAYLLARLGIIELRVRALVASRRQTDPTPDDPFRGLYLSEDHVDRLLELSGGSRVFEWDHRAQVASIESEADALEAVGIPMRLRTLARQAGLDDLDVDLLLVALAPDLDARFERLYGYLNDDVSRRRATIGLGIELCGVSSWSAVPRDRLSPDAPLTRAGLILLEEGDRPFLTRSLRVPDRVAAHLLGSDRMDPVVAGLLRPTTASSSGDVVEGVASALSDGVRLVYVRERAGASASALAAQALARAGLGAMVIDLDHLLADQNITELVTTVGREALLRGVGVVAGPIESLAERGTWAVRAVAGLPVIVILHGRTPWEPSWSRTVPLVVQARPGSTSERLESWATNLGPEAANDLAASGVISQFLLSDDQVARAVEAARLEAHLSGEAVSIDHVRAGARAQNSVSLERLARRIEPSVSWDDLILAPTARRALRELAERAIRRDQVLDEWGMRPGGGRGRGITALFAGDSGTGKTMSAEVVAGYLGLDLYTVNLATVVDKYVGETEKNLERIFTEAEGVNAVLLFDEADALFGKRSEVRDSNDRYANIEVAYLLQRMENFDGVAILATNLRANVDDAFARRLDMLVDFPTPDVALRRQLWERCLTPGVPRDDDLDLDFCAQAFELSGGNIRSIAITAAYLAAEKGTPVGMGELIQAVQREYRKLGRLVGASEFGRYYDLVGGATSESRDRG